MAAAVTLSSAFLSPPLDEKLITKMVQSIYCVFGYSAAQGEAISDYIH